MKDQGFQKGTLECHKPVEKKSILNSPTHFIVDLPAMSMYLTADIHTLMNNCETAETRRPDTRNSES